VTRLALLAQLLLLPALALAGPAPSRAVVLAASPANAEASPRITLKYHGSLRDAAERIATEGKLNVVVRGQLDEPAELFFQNVPADEALQTLALAYGLSLEKHGTIYTLRPRGSEGSPPKMIAPVPPIPPIPPTPPGHPTPPTPPPPPSLSLHHGKSDSSDEEADSDKEEGDDEDADASDAQSQWADKMARLKDLKDLKDLKGLLRFHKGSGGSDKQTVGTGNVVVEEDEEVDDAIAYGGSLLVKGRVRGDATAFGGNVHLGPHAVVHGDAVAFGGMVEREPGAKVHGETLSFGGSNGGVLGKHPLSAKSLEKHHHGSTIPGLLAQFAVYFALGFVFLMFAPKPMKQIESELRRDPLRCGLTGVLGGAAILGLTVLLTITLVGIPFAVLLLLAAAVGLAMGFSALASEVGTRLPVLKANRKTQAAVLALGILVFLVVELIPVLGPLVLFCAGCFALGATIRTRFGTRPREFPEAI
jgi:hypothetical protein